MRRAGALLCLLIAGCSPQTRQQPGESCLTCHIEETGFSHFHKPRAIGCASCHLGNPDAPKKRDAHEEMVLIPGNLANAKETCGAVGCHLQWVNSVESSLMASARGIVAVNRWVFGEADTPDGEGDMASLEQSPADTHLRQLCSTCHLGTQKTELGPLDTRSRGGGCLACHLNHDDVRDGKTHAKLTAAVPSERCFGCHSRSGRISLNYAGWHETVLSREQMDPADSSFALLADGRVVEFQGADVHHEAGIGCTDCHTSRELMGDGDTYQHQEEATEVTCEGCHDPQLDQALPWNQLTENDQKIILIRDGKPPPDGRLFAATNRPGRVITNLTRDPETPWLFYLKNRGRSFQPARPTEACSQPGHERVACQSCHSAWVPQCLGCHTQRLEDGTWQELISDFRPEPPVLGVRTFRDSTGSIEPFAPGMIMTLNSKPLAAHADPTDVIGSGSFHRLYAAQVPHTTRAGSRDCVSCHADPLTLGYGRGDLSLDGEGRWTFSPEYANLRDGLPADAWIPVLGSPRAPWSTRADARPLSVEEQRRVLLVGACLACHPGQDALYLNFEQALEETTASCQVPAS